MVAHQALLFRQLSDDVTVFSHTVELTPQDRERLQARGIRIIDGAVAGLRIDDDRITAVALADGTVVPRDVVTVQSRAVARAGFLTGLGLTTIEHPMGMGTYVVADQTGKSSVPGVYLAGNVSDLGAQVGAPPRRAPWREPASTPTWSRRRPTRRSPTSYGSERAGRGECGSAGCASSDRGRKGRGHEGGAECFPPVVGNAHPSGPDGSKSRPWSENAYPPTPDPALVGHPNRCEDGGMNIDGGALDAAAADRRLSGVVAIDRADKSLYEHCYGFAHRALAVPNTRETRFALASGSKIMTALGILRLIETGALRLTDPVRPILGDDLPLIDDAVTIEHLLGHTSGIGDYLDEEADWEASDYILPVPVHTLADTEAFVPVIDGFPQVFPPGERFSYNNGGYIVLAVIIDQTERHRLPRVRGAGGVRPRRSDRYSLPALRRAPRRRRAGLPVRRGRPDERAAPAGPRVTETAASTHESMTCTGSGGRSWLGRLSDPSWSRP